MLRAAPGYKVVAIHLFGIKHEPDLRHVSLPELVGEAGVQKSYAVEIHKGMRLAEFVRLK